MVTESMHGYRKDIAGMLWLAIALFLSLALISYYPLDPSFNSLGSFQPAKNLCGYLGSFLSDLLYQFFGLAGWIFVLLALNQARRSFQQRAKTPIFLVMVFSLFVCSSLLSLHLPEKTFFEGHIYPGGFLGNYTIKLSSPYLQTAGSYLLFWSLALALFIYITKISLFDLLAQGLRVFRAQTAQGLKAFMGRVFGPKKVLSTNPSLPVSQTEDTHEIWPSASTQKDYFFQEESKAEASAPPSTWLLPETDLLNAPDSLSLKLSVQGNEDLAKKLLAKLEQFAISGEITHIRSGPVITLFEFKPDDHIKVARISQMEDDLMIALKSKSIRIIAPIPGKDVVGIETAHNHRQTVYLKNLLEEPGFWQKAPDLPLVLGRRVDGSSAIQDLAGVPHLMVAGSTGSGKSVFILSFLISLLFRHSPETLRLLMVDPKQVDLSVFAGLPHLLSPPVRESKEAVRALNWCLNEMQKRYRSLSRFQARNLKSFNEKAKQLTSEEIKVHEVESVKSVEDSYYFTPQPYICMVLEEFGDLMHSPERSRVEALVVRLAQMARACGMHLILSMQSPRKDVVTGLIKTNIPGRISFKVSSRIDSRIILDEGGAERLLTQGDMLYLGPGQARPLRHHGPFLKEEEVLSVVNFWKAQGQAGVLNFAEGNRHLPLEGEGPQEEGEEGDQKYGEICNYVSALKEVSASHLQRKYSLGYPRAARFIDKLEEEGVIGPARGSRPREVLVHK